MNEQGDRFITPGDIPPSHIGGWELTAILMIVAGIVSLAFAIPIFGVFV